jgi:aminoglycoside phosphotransferase (APT) family kinase protein
MSDVQLTPVREAHQFDEAVLAGYMAANIADYQGPLEVSQFEGGQSNPTFLLQTANRRYVLRKQPPGELLPSAHQVDREYRVMKALQDTDVPVPVMYCLCDDASIIGTKFYVMEMVEGRLFTEALLPALTPAERKAIYLDLARVMAKLHDVDVAEVGLSEFGRPGNYYERQIGRWSKQYQASKTEQIDAMDNLMEWLPANIPEQKKTVIVGLADLGYLCQDYHADAYFSEGLSSANLEELGIPTESEFVAEYCKHAGMDQIDHWLFYVIYNMFRSAGIIQGVYKRGLDGNASSEKALEYKEVARLRSERAWKLVESLS